MAETKNNSSKLSRHSEIARFLNNQEIRSQGDLQKLLRDAGVHVTQATLSRDLEELSATKVRDSEGNLRYAIPGTAEVADHPVTLPGSLDRWCQQLLVGVDTVLNQVVLHTPSGAASALAAALDKEPPASLLGCIAGDNTVLLICNGEDSARDLAKTLRRMIRR